LPNPIIFAGNMVNSPKMVIEEIRSDILTIERDILLYEETNFDARAGAIDFLDFHIIERINSLTQTAESPGLKLNAEKIKRELEQIDIGLFKKLRENIRTGFYKGPAFKAMVSEYTRCNGAGKIGYDNLDTFINGLLFDGHLPDATTRLDQEMVFYQQTPARIIFELAEMMQLSSDEVFFDIGSGLGHVPILINLVSGAKTTGIEYEAAYCSYAKNIAAHLRLSNVQFINADAREEDYSAGTVFFLYTPFRGTMLQEMLHILKNISLKGTIRIFTYGPCSTEVARQTWLGCLNGSGDDFYKLYEFKSLSN
jgi:hypothetical protein